MQERILAYSGSYHWVRSSFMAGFEIGSLEVNKINLGSQFVLIKVNMEIIDCLNNLFTRCFH